MIFTEGERVYLDGFGTYARFLNYEPSYDGSGQVIDPIGYSKVELEDYSGRIHHAPLPCGLSDGFEHGGSKRC